MRSVFFDVMCGASGDMILAALIDAGAPLDRLQSDLGRLGIPGLSVGVERANRHGMAASHMLLSWETPREYRHLHEILEIIGSGGYPDRVMERCRAVLNRLAEAEAAVHGTTVDHVHFHEIGAIDTIVDVAGAALCLEYLGIDTVLFSTLTDGHGTVKTAHGAMPVPVPATARMIQGLSFRGLDVDGELLTPTGAAVLTALGTQCAGLPQGTLAGVGVGCGDKKVEHYANVLRLFLVEDAQGGSADSVCVLESDMDHVSGEVMAFAAEECMAQGALDVSWLPLLMKKGRPGYRLTVVCESADRERLAELAMRHTRTLGVRWHEARRMVARRSHGETTLGEQRVREKHCSMDTYSFSKPEYEDMARMARDQNRPILDVYEEYVRTRTSRDA